MSQLRRSRRRRSIGRTQGDSGKGGRFVIGRWRRWLLALLLFAAVVVGALHYADLKKLAELVSKAEPQWLVGALHLHMLSYFTLADEWFLVLRAVNSSQN